MSVHSATITTPTPHVDMSTRWGVLQIFNIYSLCLILVLFFMAEYFPSFHALGRYHPGLFNSTIAVYMAYGLISIFTVGQQTFAFQTQVRAHVSVNILVLTILMHCGDMHNVFAILINASIAGGSLLTAGRTSLLFAAIATFAVFIEQQYNLNVVHSVFRGYTNAGIMGATFFATAILGYGLSRRIRASEALAEQRGVDLHKLEQLNDYIIQHMQSGVLVIDEHDNICLMNSAAKRLLNISENKTSGTLSQFSDALRTQLNAWKQYHDNQQPPFKAEHDGSDVMAQFIPVKSGDDELTLIILDDCARTFQQAQQLKLASLGKFTASIAHEIRNPIGAISHAGQLLEESEHIAEVDKRLIEIICQQTEKVNKVVKNVLHLSRQNDAIQQNIELQKWLSDFISDLYVPELGDLHVDLHVNSESLSAYVDPDQLYQIMMNLCLNGLRYSKEKTGRASLLIEVGQVDNSNAIYIDVIDDGPGVAPDNRERIFEPFYTTGRQGNGLGLYIASELCAMNHARIAYRELPQGGCFRISFS